MCIRDRLFSPKGFEPRINTDAHGLKEPSPGLRPPSPIGWERDGVRAPSSFDSRPSTFLHPCPSVVNNTYPLHVTAKASPGSRSSAIVLSLIHISEPTRPY